MVLGIIDKNAVLVIGRTEPDRLEKVLSAYGTYQDHHKRDRLGPFCSNRAFVPFGTEAS